MDRFDLAVIGTGPAGLEAAITAKVRNKSVLLLGSKGLSNKMNSAHSILNYLGLPNISGEDMAKVFMTHLAEMEIDITEDKVNAVYAMGDYFAIQGHGADYEATSVIIAAGLTAFKPLPGELENLGRGVSYCATCDAALYKEKEAIVLAYSPEDETEAKFLAERASRVYYLPQYDYAGSLDGNIIVKEKLKPMSIEMANGKAALLTEKERFNADGIFVLRQQVAPSQLVPGLQMDGNHVAVDRHMATNIRGLFAAGDITGSPYQYIKAAGEGNVAALAAVSYIDSLKNKDRRL